MTVTERLTALLGFSPAKNAAEAELLDQGIPDGTIDYDTSLLLQIKKAAINIIRVLLSTADTTTDNNGISFKTVYDRTAVLARLKQLEQDTGVQGEDLPTIKAPCVW